MATIQLAAARKSYGSAEIIRNIDLEIHDREFVVFVGPSGCGKSTLLRMIAGLEDIDAGDLLIDGHRCNDVPPDERGLAMVFQSYALYPHMSVADNMGFALKLAGVTKEERHRKVAAVAETLQLAHLLERRPKELSGGQRQRVAIGRAIVRNPKVFLFDEPLSNLDASLRVRMRGELIKLHRQLDATMIYVTHDQVEAMTMADRIVILNQGRIEQVGTPLQLYREPSNLFVAGFLGSPTMNFIQGEVVETHAKGSRIRLESGAMLSVPHVGLVVGSTVTTGLRPESLAVSIEGQLRGVVEFTEHLGDVLLVYMQLPGGKSVTAKVPEGTPAVAGDRIAFSVEEGAISVFDAAGNALSKVSAQDFQP